MTSQPGSMAPPRVAEWILTLFATGKEGEPISGDLYEEFSMVAVQSGLRSARAWYRRQVFLTAVHLTWAAFRTAPLSMFALAAGSFWFLGFATRFSSHAMQAFLDAHRYYDLHPDAYLFWLKFPFETGRVILCVLIGGSMALLAKHREMAAVIGLVLLQSVLFSIGAITLAVTGRDWVQWFVAMALWNGLCGVSMLAGGALVRIRRSRSESRPASVSSA